MKYGNEIKVINGIRYEIVKVKCNCPCHQKGRMLMHFIPCCDGGYLTHYNKIEDERPDWKTLKIPVKVQDNWLGDYRLEYDGKYVTLFGKDKNYKGFKWDESDEDWYEEMVLDACVCEIRDAKPWEDEITEVGGVLYIGMGVPKNHRVCI